MHKRVGLIFTTINVFYIYIFIFFYGFFSFLKMAEKNSVIYSYPNTYRDGNLCQILVIMYLFRNQRNNILSGKTLIQN